MELIHPRSGKPSSTPTKDIVVALRPASCRLADLEARDTKQADGVLWGCDSRQGSATVEIAFPEQAPFLSTGPLILFNGGERGGVVTFLAYTYVSVAGPRPRVVTTATLIRERKARSFSTPVKIPRIAGGPLDRPARTQRSPCL